MFRTGDQDREKGVKQFQNFPNDFKTPAESIKIEQTRSTLGERVVAELKEVYFNSSHRLKKTQASLKLRGKKLKKSLGDLIWKQIGGKSEKKEKK